MRALLFSTTALVATAASAQDVPVQLDDVIIQAPSRIERPVLDTPLPAAVVEPQTNPTDQRAEFSRTLSSDVSQLLADVPGVTIQGGPRPIAQTPNIRGFVDDQIVLRVDGGRQNFNLTHRGRFFFDADLVQRVEIARGAGSSLYGSGALGGVIEFETVDATDLLDDGDTFGGRATLGYADNGEAGNGSLALASRFGDLDALFAYAERSSNEDLTDGDGDDIPFSEFDSNQVLFKLGYDISPGQRLEFSYSDYTDSGLVPAAANQDSSPTNPVVDRDASVRDLRLSYSLAPEENPWVNLTATLYSNVVDIEENAVTIARRDETDYETLGFEVINQSTFNLGVPVTTVYGIAAFQDTQTAQRDSGPRGSFPDAKAQTIGIFAEGTFELTDQIDLSIGGRFDMYERDPDNAALDDVDEDFFSPRIAISYRPNDDWQIYGNLSQAFRAPSLSELYNDGLHFAGGRFFPPDNFFVPNPNLDPETSTQIEFGTRFESQSVFAMDDSLRFGANVYYAEVDDLIDTVVNVPAGTTTTRNVDARIWGLEADVSYDRDLWFVSAGLTLPRGEERGTSIGLGSIPQDKLTTTVGFRPAEGWEFGARGTFTADQDNLPANGNPTDGYQTLDLFASYAATSGPLEGVVFRAGVDNVNDEVYSVFPNPLNQAGQTWKFSISYEF